MLPSEHNMIIKKATPLAPTHKIVVQDVSGSRLCKAVYAVPNAKGSEALNSVNQRPVGELIWEGRGTMTEMRSLCWDLKRLKLRDPNAKEEFRSSRANTGYYDPT